MNQSGLSRRPRPRVNPEIVPSSRFATHASSPAAMSIDRSHSDRRADGPILRIDRRHDAGTLVQDPTRLRRPLRSHQRAAELHQVVRVQRLWVDPGEVPLKIVMTQPASSPAATPLALWPTSTSPILLPVVGSTRYSSPSHVTPRRSTRPGRPWCAAFCSLVPGRYKRTGHNGSPSIRSIRTMPGAAPTQTVRSPTANDPSPCALKGDVLDEGIIAVELVDGVGGERPHPALAHRHTRRVVEIEGSPD